MVAGKEDRSSFQLQPGGVAAWDNVPGAAPGSTSDSPTTLPGPLGALGLLALPPQPPLALPPQLLCKGARGLGSLEPFVSFSIPV